MKRLWAALLLLLIGCSTDSKWGSTELAKQVTITQAELRPWTNSEGRHFQCVWVKWRNNGPKPIGALYARIMAYDAQGNPHPDNAEDRYCIYVAARQSDVVRAGGEGDHGNEEGAGYDLELLPTTNPMVRVDVTPISASEKWGLGN